MTVSLTREQAEFVVRAFRLYCVAFDAEAANLPAEACFDNLPNLRNIYAAKAPYDELASEIERQLASQCSCSPGMISLMCPVHGEELAKEEMEFTPPDSAA